MNNEIEAMNELAEAVNQKRQLQLLGLAQKAGDLVSGTDQVILAIERKKAKLVVITEDTSESSQKKLLNKCVHYNVPYTIFGTSMQLSQALGKKRNVVALTNQGFKKSFLKTKGNTHMN
ncbi:L7Ae/L30e/S12e/Gadd45 family ribosomal protein [Atopobacter phocae]|uniref:L7Ae/L30e/S12e/Gadd45 family ribosomal protein n=1 Tax=Atopobacter phocae TaxID=136492 RepID=UPI00047195D1|nr:ribosomal L7Ae/L30e/S12e/Gadd45 family protein [Atopobacter phocae]